MKIEGKESGILEGNWLNKSGKAQHRQDVKDVRSNDVSDSDITFSLSCGHETCSQFWYTRAKSHHSYCHKSLRHTEMNGKGANSTDEEFCAKGKT